jgi:hypothetical protein
VKRILELKQPNLPLRTYIHACVRQGIYRLPRVNVGAAVQQDPHDLGVADLRRADKAPVQVLGRLRNVSV